METLCEVGEGRFLSAYNHALKASHFRPDISEIRRYAGLDPDHEARRELRSLIAAMRIHKRCLKRRYGAMVNGQWQDDAPGSAWKPEPVLAELVTAALLDLGFGDRQAGLNVIWEHPALDSARTSEETEKLPLNRSAERIERRWYDAYLRATVAR